MDPSSSPVRGRACIAQRHIAVLFALLTLVGNGSLASAVRAAGSHVPVQIFSSAAPTHRLIALTFDDGPSLYTPQILTVLARFHAHATFFLVGQHVPTYAGAVRQAVAAGDELGNHTYNHFDVERLPTAFVVDQLGSTQNAVRVASGVTPHWFRPPYGLGDLRVASIAAAMGLRTILWSVDPRDWSRPGTDAIAARVLYAAQPGSVVIMHDGGGDRSQTVAALSVILSGLQERGYIFATLDELFGLTPPPLCNALQEKQANHWFSVAGEPAHPHDMLYQSWQSMYCDGRNLGPATSQEYQLGPGITGQNFARTGHRLEWDAQIDSARITLDWPWAIADFHARGIWPAWHTPITMAWFTQFFDGHGRGAALESAHWNARLHGTVQCFENGCALAPRQAAVTWEPPQVLRG